ncbi:MAG: transposase [Firmicutes bacterium]|nr:transposase [Bacillota bacterium]
MRGIDHQQADMFSYLSPEQRVREDHPLRTLRAMTGEILGDHVAAVRCHVRQWWASVAIPPEKLLRAQLLQMLYSVRSERLLMEEIDYSILFRWFVGLNLDARVWDATTFTKNRDRLLEAAVAKELLAQGVERERAAGLVSDEHFTCCQQKKRKRIEGCFGWIKDIALLRKLKHRGLFKVGWIFSFAAAAYNLVRLRRLIPIAPAA